MRILIAEDDPAIASGLQCMLRQSGHAVDWAKDGEEANVKARGVPYDVIVLDLMLPKIDGLTLLQGWRKDGLSSHVLILTAKDQLPDKIKGLDLGADDYLTKPVGNDDLVRAIEIRLHGAAQQEQARREFKADFSSLEPLVKLGLTPRATEALLWLAQGKTNADIATILGISESTVKKYVQEIFEKLGVETRGAATVRALEVLNSPESSENRR